MYCLKASYFHYFFYIYRGLFCCVGLPIVTSDGLAGRLLQWRAISPVIKAHKSDPRGRHDNGDLANASLNICMSGCIPKDSGGETSGGGDMFLAL